MTRIFSLRLPTRLHHGCGWQPRSHGALRRDHGSLGANAADFIPFFATTSADSDYDGSNPNGNIQTIDIPIGQHSAWKYFGCFLDVYDSANQSKFPTARIIASFAEINYSGAPIVNTNGVTESPENCDKLAQRNLQITPSGNPSFPDTHRIPQTFDTRPNPAPGGTGTLPDYPDELMVDWGNMPVGSVASIYWPQVNSQDVLDLAEKLYPAPKPFQGRRQHHQMQCHPRRHLYSDSARAGKKLRGLVYGRASKGNYGRAGIQSQGAPDRITASPRGNHHCRTEQEGEGTPQRHARPKSGQLAVHHRHLSGEDTRGHG